MPRIRWPLMRESANGVVFRKTGISPWRCGRKNSWDKCGSRPIFTVLPVRLKSRSQTKRHQYRDRSRTSVQAGIISQPHPGQHRGLRPFLALCSSLRISFVKKACWCNSDGRLQSFCSRSPSLGRRPPGGTTSRASIVQVQVLPRAPFRPASIKVMQRTFNPLNGEHYPGGPTNHCLVV